MTRFFQSSRDVSVLLVVLLAAVLALTSPYFLTTGNLDSVQTLIAPTGIIALGMMVLLICGLFDLSVGSAMGLSGIVCAILLSFGLPIPLAILAALQPHPPLGPGSQGSAARDRRGVLLSAAED